MAEFRVTAKTLRKAHQVFKKREPRDLFYRVATELLDLARRGSTSLSVAESLAVLLQTWNKNRYRFEKFDANHFKQIERLLSRYSGEIALYKRFDLACLKETESRNIIDMFQSFELVLGPVGTAKALHLLAPSFFPIWDRRIAESYKLRLGQVGTNGDRYWQFILISKHQCQHLRRSSRLGKNLLKLLDEYNYCKYTLRLNLA